MKYILILMLTMGFGQDSLILEMPEWNEDRGIIDEPSILWINESDDIIPFYDKTYSLGIEMFGASLFVFELNTMSIKVDSSIIARMTKAEFQDWMTLYITCSSITYYLSDSISAVFFDREITINNDVVLESLCIKYLPQWIFDEPINRKEKQ